jgi:putative phage-type endonuclease
MSCNKDDKPMSAVSLVKPADWHADRAKGIGGSDAATIMGGDWLALWEEKTGRREPDDLSNVLPVQLGTFTEPFNRAWFAQQTGMAVDTTRCDGIVHPAYPFMRANIDGRVGLALLECKHTNAFAKDDEIVGRYFWQCQHYMAVCAAPATYLSVIFGNMRWDYFEVAADFDAITELMEREAEFWWHVETDTQPETQAASAAPVIAFDAMREADMTGDNEFAASAADWLANKTAAKTFEDATKALKAKVDDDVKLAFGHGVKVSRSKAGSLTIRSM